MKKVVSELRRWSRGMVALEYGWTMPRGVDKDFAVSRAMTAALHEPASKAKIAKEVKKRQKVMPGVHREARGKGKSEEETREKRALVQRSPAPVAAQRPSEACPTPSAPALRHIGTQGGARRESGEEKGDKGSVSSCPTG